MNRHRYALLAGTMLSVFAMPQLSAALDMNSVRSHDGAMVVAQGGAPDDPKQKGKQQERKGPPSGQPPGQRPGGPPPQHGSSGQPQGGQQKQFGQQPGGQPGGRGPVSHGDNEPKGGAPKQSGRQPGGNPPGGPAPRTGQQGGPGGEPKGVAPKQYGRQPGSNPSGGPDPRTGQQGGPGGEPKGSAPKQYGRPGGNPPGGQDPRTGQQGGPGGEPKGGAPKQLTRQPGGNPPGGPDARTGQQGGPGGEPKGGAPKQFGQQPSANPSGGPDQRFQQGSGAPRQSGNQPSGGSPQGGPSGDPRSGPPQQYGNQPGRPGDRDYRQGGAPGGDPRGGPPRQYGNQPGGSPGRPDDRDHRQGGSGGDQRGGPAQQYGGRGPDDRRGDGRDFRFGNVDQLRSQRRERREGDRTIIEEPDHRMIVREGNRTIIRHDEGERFRRWGGGEGRVERRGGETYTTIGRPGGYDIITVTDSNGRLLRRIRRGPDHREVVLIDNRPRGGRGAAGAAAAGFAAGVFLGLAAPAIAIPRDRYIVDADQAPPALLYDTLEAPPVDRIERPYSLDEVRYNVELRDRMRRVDINNINFDTGSWEVAPDQYNRLDALADALHRVLERNPQEIFMIEGHTDAVGNDDDNLSLSDRRAESIAEILTQNFNIPPENLVTQGYGEQYLKVQTDGPSRENRRAVVRRIGPLLTGQNQN